MTGVKDVTLTPADQPAKAKRRSALAGVKELERRLIDRRAELANAKADLDAATLRHQILEAEVFAMTDAYNDVKPQPRTRKAATK